MATQFPKLRDPHLRLIAESPLFFVATAAAEGRVNLSPKGMERLKVLDPNRIIWMNLPGSGNETAGHLLKNPRITLMWCSFSERPMILRAYGTARAVHPGAPDWEALSAHFPDSHGNRQVFDVTVDLVQTSCGFGVPMMATQGNRDELIDWADHQGPAGVSAYWQKKNQVTIDGFPTGIGADLAE
ncbi:MAG: pyridoxamine 5'-phosphate oxidase family protein [Pseudomonadota bacterium]